MNNDVAKDSRKTSQRDQTQRNLVASAEGGRTPGPAVQAIQVKTPNTKLDAINSTAAIKDTPPCYTCKVHIKVAVFFDGTGNNLDADIGTKEHSNVARLFRSHPINDSAKAIYRIYVPGLGTYFKDIGDPGDDDGMAFGKRGEPRMDWAMAQIDKHVAAHPADKITGLDISLFGFSRGAALARAFAIRLQERCSAKNNEWMWNKKNFAAKLYFMGLFDTVASVGLPASSSLRSLRIAKKHINLQEGLKARRDDLKNGLSICAFGNSPGADPTPGVIDGHMDWASDLRLPAMAKKCIHYFSTHEQRNSFPLDSARDGNHVPEGTEERWCPGVHSNVGGGYRPGESGRSKLNPELLSQMPLLAMHTDAIASGVPLNPKDHPESGDDFAIDNVLASRYKEYIQVADQHCSTKSAEGRLLGNTKLLFAWRFKRIRERGAAARPDAGKIQDMEQTTASDRAKLDKEIATAENAPARLAAQARLEAAQREKDNASASYYALTRKDWVDTEKMAAALARLKTAEANLAAAKKDFADADDAHMRLKARKATLPGSGLTVNLHTYDSNLLLDIEHILKVRQLYPKLRLRPHYANLIAAFEAEYVHKKGLLDAHPEVLALFDNYVHDSLAGFAKDETLSSDPRVMYIGKDVEAQYAMLKDPTIEGQSALA